MPISAFIFGGRRARLAPLVYESHDWQHGVFVGATMASETTAAATGAVGVTRRDPMAMLPFCGYNMADYFRALARDGPQLKHPPKIFHVNWFRTRRRRKIPVAGLRRKRPRAEMDARSHRRHAPPRTETPIGNVPTPDALTLDGLDMTRETMEELLSVDPAAWAEEHADPESSSRNSAIACRRRSATSTIVWASACSASRRPHVISTTIGQ